MGMLRWLACSPGANTHGRGKSGRANPFACKLLPAHGALPVPSEELPATAGVIQCRSRNLFPCNLCNPWLSGPGSGGVVSRADAVCQIRPWLLQTTVSPSPGPAGPDRPLPEGEVRGASLRSRER